MTIFDNYEVWFVIGSQHLYGPETLRQVTQHAEHVVNALNTEAKLPCKLVLKPLVWWCGCTLSPRPKCGSTA